MPSRALILIVLLFVVTPVCWAADSDPDFKEAKAAFLREMKKKAPAARADAVIAFAEVAQPETAELILKRGLIDTDAQVRVAVQKALRKLVDERPTRMYLFDEYKKSLRKSGANDTVAELLRALVCTDDEELQPELVKSLDEHLTLPKSNILLPMTLIDDFGQRGGTDAVRAVKLMSGAKVFESKFGYRRCVVQAMCRIREPDAVTFLVELTPKVEGLIQHDVADYLTRLTKKKFRDNSREWNLWWKANKAAFTFPAPDAIATAEPLDTNLPAYYGLPICAKRVVFVLDTSMSMRGQPMELAKQALIKVITSLPESVAFDVVMFDKSAEAWQPRLLPATDANKSDASRTVMARGMKLGTASHAALTATFGLEPEVIYFLSDGEPTDGQPSQIVSSVAALNRTQRVSIHTIGVVTDRGGGIGLTRFMQPLAQQNYGNFQLVQ